MNRLLIAICVKIVLEDISTVFNYLIIFSYTFLKIYFIILS